MAEPASSDVLSVLRRIDSRFDGLEARFTRVEQEVHVQGLELRSSVAEVRLSVTELRSTVLTVVDSLADFRRQYDQHSHPPEQDAA